MSTSPITQIVRCPACGKTNRVDLTPDLPGRTPVCGQCRIPLFQTSGPLIATDFNYQETVVESPLPVLLDLWAPWCGPCRMLAPIIAELAEELAGQVRVAKLNVDDNPQVSSGFGIRGIPTLLILQQGKEVGRIIGMQSKAAILKQLRSVL